MRLIELLAKLLGHLNINLKREHNYLRLVQNEPADLIALRNYTIALAAVDRHAWLAQNLQKHD
ncbi:MAG: hypothetical protein OHK0050_44920 [Roseiflexaceae bacterium]